MNAIFSSLIFIFFSALSCLARGVNYTEHTLAIFQEYKMPSLEINFLNGKEELYVGLTGFRMHLNGVTVAPTAPFEMMSNICTGGPVDGQPGLHKLWGRVKPRVMLVSMNGTVSYWRPGTQQEGNLDFVASNAKFGIEHFWVNYDVIFNPMERQVHQVNITVDTLDFTPKSGFEHCFEYVKGLCHKLVETVQEVLNEGRNFKEHPILSRAIAQQLEKDRRNY